MRRGSLRLKKSFSTKSVSIFNHELKKRQRDWSLSRQESGDYDYLRTFAAERLVDRLDDINRDFETALDFGCHRGHILKAILKQNELSTGRGAGGIKQLYQTDISRATESDLSSKSDMITSEFLPLSCIEAEYKNVLVPNTYNLVMSSLWLHWTNDIPSLLRNILLSLKPDGVFLGCMLGGSTLEEFRHAFYLAETERKSGISPHMSPLVRPSDAAALLQGAGYALPTIDIDTVTVRYENAFALMEHVREMGEGHAATNRSLTGGKESFLAMAAAYQRKLTPSEPRLLFFCSDMFGADDGTVEASFQIISMIGWRPHESQPKPLRRGSAEKSMTEIPKSSSS